MHANTRTPWHTHLKSRPKPPLSPRTNKILAFWRDFSAFDRTTTPPGFPATRVLPDDLKCFWHRGRFPFYAHKNVVMMRMVMMMMVCAARCDSVMCGCRRGVLRRCSPRWCVPVAVVAFVECLVAQQLLEVVVLCMCKYQGVYIYMYV